MQPTLRTAIRPARQTGALIRRSIHSSSSSSNPAVLLTESRHSAEPFRQNNEFLCAHTRTISYGRPTSTLTSAGAKFPPLGPRAKAHFTSSIARQNLGFMPFESSVIFPTFESFSAKDLEGEVRVPFLPDNFHPERAPEPEYVVTKPIITTVADAITHIAAPSAIMEGLTVTLSFAREPSETNEDVEAGMMRAFRM